MAHSPCGIATLCHLMCILFLNFFLSGVNAQVAQNVNPRLLNRCPTPTDPQSLWWFPLLDGKRHDPCQVFRHVRDSKFTVDCCFNEPSGQNHSKRDHGHDNKSFGGGGGGDGDGGGDEGHSSSCGPCNMPTYNLASACIACERFPNITAPSNKDTTGSGFPSSQSWMENDKASSSSFSNHFLENFLPLWTNISATNDGFNVDNVLQTANKTVGSKEMSAKNVTKSPSTPTSPEGSAEMPPQNAASSKVRAGAIAGGVIGGLLLLALLAFALLYVLRKRRRQRSAPSSEFSAVSAPTTQDRDEKPPQFNAKSWRAPALQKWQGASTGASQHGLMSNAAWNRDIEKEKY